MFLRIKRKQRKSANIRRQILKQPWKCILPLQWATWSLQLHVSSLRFWENVRIPQHSTENEGKLKILQISPINGYVDDMVDLGGMFDIGDIFP